MDASRIIVVLPNWVGDAVMATPALRALRCHYGSAHLTFVARPYVADVVADLGWADRLSLWPVGANANRKQGLVRLAHQLRRDAGGRPDLAILLANSFRSALLATLAGARRRVGYDRDGRGLLLSDRLVAHRMNGRYVPVPMIRYYNGIADFLGCRNLSTRMELPSGPAYDELYTGLKARAGISEKRPLVVIHAGAAFGTSKCWLPERFADVADRLTDAHDAQIVFTCGPNEQEIIRTVRKHLRRPAVLLDDVRTTLREAMALIRGCDLLICNDTGPRHFAAAYGVPVVTLFGPTDPVWSETEFELERKVAVPIDCAPCQKPVCPLKHHQCMTRISAEMVVSAATQALADRATT